jgi:hypothetical protein
MATKIRANGQTVVHKTSDGILITAPDVCKTPMGSSVVPIPYCNTSVSKDTLNGSTTVFADGKPFMLKDSVFFKSTGDEPGVARGVGSGTVGSVAKFTNYSFDVKVEGRNVCRRLDPMTSNKGNTPPAALMQPNVEAEGLEGKYLLPIAFVYKHPDVVTERVTQPIFQTPHTVSGPETHRQENPDYAGALHLCDQPDGKYQLTFDEFNREEEIFE